jgi:hypothetical protein
MATFRFLIGRQYWYLGTYSINSNNNILYYFKIASFYSNKRFVRLIDKFDVISVALVATIIK